MQLAERDLLTWGPGYDHLINGALLRRPARKFDPGEFDGLNANWEQMPERRLDAALTSHLRYLSRDLYAHDQATNYKLVENVADPTNNWNVYPPGTQPDAPKTLVPPEVAGGVASWNDQSATAMAAQNALREAAGVTVPGPSFVLACLGIYLFLLVPFNWMIFYSIGKVEWAWIAAPIISLATTWIVVKQAQLDIGFVRAHSEVGILETQPGYDRGHFARFTGLYTSLSSTYDMTFEDSSTLAAPLGREDFSLLPNQSYEEISFDKQDEVHLNGILVSSSFTNMIHSEEMYSLGGALVLGKSSLGQLQVENRTRHPLRNVALLHRDGERTRAAWIGDLNAGSSALVNLPVVPGGGPLFTAERLSGAKPDKEALNLEPLFQIALDPEKLAPGEIRLVGQIDGMMPGVSVNPSASQTQGATVVVAHLDYGPLPPPAQDANSPLDVVTIKE